VRIQQKVAEKGLTLVPLTLYFLGKWVKVELAVVRGRKLHDKRDAIREREDRREMLRSVRER
jgi:SsrA-binding protein